MTTSDDSRIETDSRIRLDIAYDGTDFHGWARQPGQRTVCGVIEEQLGLVLRNPVDLTVAGRTDAGVHARGQVAHFDLAAEWLDQRSIDGEPANLVRRLTRLLTGVTAEDTQCGFKLFRGEVARDLFRRGVLDGFSFDLELLYLAARDGLRVVEVPVRWVDAPDSKVDPVKDSVKFLKDVLMLRRLHGSGHPRGDGLGQRHRRRGHLRVHELHPARVHALTGARHRPMALAVAPAHVDDLVAEPPERLAHPVGPHAGAGARSPFDDGRRVEDHRAHPRPPPPLPPSANEA